MVSLYSAAYSCKTTSGFDEMHSCGFYYNECECRKPVDTVDDDIVRRSDEGCQV